MSKKFKKINNIKTITSIDDVVFQSDEICDNCYCYHYTIFGRRYDVIYIYDKTMKEPFVIINDFDGDGEDYNVGFSRKHTHTVRANVLRYFLLSFVTTRGDYKAVMNSLMNKGK